MRGGFRVEADEACGWVVDPDAGGLRLEARLCLGARVVGQGPAALPRPDVAEALGVAGDHGFRFPLTVALPEADRLQLEARRMPDAPWQPVAPAATGSPRPHHTLAALRLDLLAKRKGGRARPLEGLSVLDVGCGGGSLCGEALRLGARRVLGIDLDAALLERARAEHPGADFAQGSWWDLPRESFDVILFLPASAGESDLAERLARLGEHLAPGGTLVIELGIARRSGRVWQVVRRRDGRRRYPSQALFQDELAATFSTRWVADGADPPGDPIRRRIFHCVPRAGTVILLAGKGRVGKTTLAREVELSGIPVVRTDRLIGALLREARFDGSPLAEAARRLPVTRPMHLGRIGDVLAARHPAAFVEALIAELPVAPVVVIEGEILRHRSVGDPLAEALRARNLRPWILQPQRPSRLGAAASRLVAASRMFAAMAARRRRVARPPPEPTRALGERDGA